MRVVELEARHVRIPLQAEGDARQPRPHRDRQRRRAVRAVRRQRSATARACRAITSPAKPSTSPSTCSSGPTSRKQLDADCPDFVAAVHLAERLKLAAVARRRPHDPGQRGPLCRRTRGARRLRPGVRRAADEGHGTRRPGAVPVPRPRCSTAASSATRAAGRSGSTRSSTGSPGSRR